MYSLVGCMLQCQARPVVPKVLKKSVCQISWVCRPNEKGMGPAVGGEETSQRGGDVSVADTHITSVLGLHQKAACLDTQATLLGVDCWPGSILSLC